MATEATITISSDIAPGIGTISKSMTLTQAGTITDIDSTTGFSIRKLNATGAVDLVTMASELVEPKDSTAAKIYIRNIGDGQGNIDKSTYVEVGINSQAIGRLYGGDWLMMPLTVIDADDVTVNPETDNVVVLEYIMFYEEA
tara:strand:+ start:461 stop:886 length:426 start_codon:yes stop_codon:yes gene_type:complete